MCLDPSIGLCIFLAMLFSMNTHSPTRTSTRPCPSHPFPLTHLLYLVPFRTGSLRPRHPSSPYIYPTHLFLTFIVLHLTHLLIMHLQILHTTHLHIQFLGPCLLIRRQHVRVSSPGLQRPQVTLIMVFLPHLHHSI